MADAQLQYGLIAMGAAAVVALIGYNYWQERRARKSAEKAFRSEHRDVLLDGSAEPVVPPPVAGDRIEPRMAASEAPSAATTGRASAGLQQTPVGRAAEPTIPFEYNAIDCVVAIEAPAGVSATSLIAGQQAVLAGLSRPLRWFGFDEASNAWQELDARTPGSFNRLFAALQLVDRRGAIGEAELERFLDTLQRLCDQFLAVPRLPVRAQVLAHAAEIDRFCSDFDIRIAVNLIAGEQPILGTKLRGLAEAAGLSLRTDGCYHAMDESERSLFTLANSEAAAFSIEQLRHLQTQAVTLSLDVPRVVRPALAFDRMMLAARQMAEALGASIVDDNRNAITPRSIELIRAQIAQFEQQMERQGIPAGGELALRLFV